MVDLRTVDGWICVCVFDQLIYLHLSTQLLVKICGYEIDKRRRSSITSH
jgi:hypothetical protein